MDWVINPLVGVGPLRLGMQTREVANILDPLHPIVDRSKVFDGSIAESRGLELPACSYDDNVLRGIDTNHAMKNVIFLDKLVYETDPREIMKCFAKYNGGAKFGLGVLLFESISISAIGFFDAERKFQTRNVSNDGAYRGVNAYVKNAFSKFLSHFDEIDLEKFR